MRGGFFSQVGWCGLSRMVLLEPEGMVSKSRAPVSSRQVPKAPPQTHAVWCEFWSEFKIQIWVILLDFRKEIHGGYNGSYGVPTSFLQSGTLRILELNKGSTEFILPSGHMMRLEELWRVFLFFFFFCCYCCLFGWLVGFVCTKYRWDLRSLTRDGIHALCSGSWNSCFFFFIFNLYSIFHNIALCFVFLALRHVVSQLLDQGSSLHLLHWKAKF